VNTGWCENGARFAAAPIASGGTPTSTWLGWQRDFPQLNLDECPGLVVVGPHPDDETLGFGATAAALRARGVAVQVVSVSDGGGAYPDLSRMERIWLERDRRAELSRATAALGLGEPICLGLPDGELREHESYVIDVVGELLTSGPGGAWCATSWRGDGHPDHEAVGRAASTAAHRTGAIPLEYPVWMWHWARPEDPDVPWHRMFRSPLDRTAVARKREAVNHFQSQLMRFGSDFEPVLPPLVIQRLLRVGEVVFR
jgi:LmbE family N-acetylglucosaminyl deacetylase